MALEQLTDVMPVQRGLAAALEKGVIQWAPMPTWRGVVAVAGWAIGGLAAGTLLTVLGGLLLGFVLRDRNLGCSLGALASLLAPVVSFAVPLLVSGFGFVRHVWPSYVLASILLGWAVTTWARLAWSGARCAVQPRLAPSWSAAVFVLGCVLIWRLASEVAFLPSTLFQLAIASAVVPAGP